MMGGLPLSLLVLLVIHQGASAISLAEGLRIVTSSGRDVMISRAEEAAAEGGVSLARAPLLPSLDLYAYQSWLRHQPEAAYGQIGTVPLSERVFLTYGFRLEQLLYDFGRTRSTLRAARIGLKAERLGTERVRNLVALEFVLAYLDLLEAERLLRVARNEVRRLEAHFSDVDAMYGEGLLTRNDLLEAEVVLSDARQRLLTVENRRDLRASRVNSLLLRPLDEEVGAEEPEANPVLDLTLEEAWEIAGRERVELKIADAGIEAKTAELASLRAEYLPRLYLSGGYEFAENRYMVHEGNWSLVAGITLNLLSGGATGSKVERAEAELRRLGLEREKLLDLVRLEVKAAYLELGSSRQKVKVTEKAVEQAEENLRLQRLRFREGVATATDVIDAVTLLTRAETNYWMARYDLRRAEARLLHSMGRRLLEAYGAPGRD